MQHGASLTSSQLLKILTKGNTARLSAEPLLNFFQPLRAWLEQQNRNEVIGWNSNIEDVSLFKPLINGARHPFNTKCITIAAIVISTFSLLCSHRIL